MPDRGWDKCNPFFFFYILFCVSPGPHPHSHANLNPFWIHHHNIPDLYKSLLVEGLACDCAEPSCEDTAAQSCLNLSTLSKLKQKKVAVYLALTWNNSVFVRSAGIPAWMINERRTISAMQNSPQSYLYLSRSANPPSLSRFAHSMPVYVCACLYMWGVALIYLKGRQLL